MEKTEVKFWIFLKFCKICLIKLQFRTQNYNFAKLFQHFVQHITPKSWKNLSLLLTFIEKCCFCLGFPTFWSSMLRKMLEKLSKIVVLCTKLQFYEVNLTIFQKNNILLQFSQLCTFSLPPRRGRGEGGEGGQGALEGQHCKNEKTAGKVLKFLEWGSKTAGNSKNFKKFQKKIKLFWNNCR